MDTRHIYSPPRTLVIALLALLSGLAMTTPAMAQSVKTKYERAQVREEATRRLKSPSVASLRAIATSYENIVRQHPRSGYSDNALWQAAGLLQLAWERAGNRADRDKAVTLLQWLRKEYPTSALARQVPTQITALNRTRTPAARTAAPARPPSATAARAETPAREENAVAAPPARPRPMPVASSTRPPASPADESAAAAPNRAAVVLRGVSHTTLPRGDRITLELSQEASYAADRADGSNRLTVALADAAAAAAIVDAAGSIRGDLIQALRLNQAASGLQLIVELDGQPRHSVFPLYDPYRLVFDFETEAPAPASAGHTATAVPRPFPLFGAAETPAATETVAARELPAHVPAVPPITPPVPAAATLPPPAASKPAPATVSPVATAVATPEDNGPSPGEEIPASTTKPAPPASTSAGGYSLARQLGLGVSRIVIDPGHGGSDPGAQANGVTESALVLDVALRLEKLLQAQPGFEVVLTRRTNQAVALARRTAIANEEQADLFLSIHANSSPRTTTAGVETYFLNFSSNEHAESVAARENASSAQDMRILPDLVRAIAMNNKLAESRELAGVVQSSLVRRLQPRNKLFQDLGVKQAPFVVLIGAQMPSVLAEIAFLTNRAESSLLKQNAYKQQIAQALCDAILKYRASLKQVSPVTVSAEGR